MQNRIDSSEQNRHVDKPISRAAPHFYKYAFGSIIPMLCDRIFLISIISQKDRSNYIKKKLTDISALPPAISESPKYSLPLIAVYR